MPPGGFRLAIVNCLNLEAGRAARARLAAFKVPVRVAFWPQLLPRNPNGKILKDELKDAFE